MKFLRHLETKNALYLKPVEIFFNLFAVSPPGREPWSYNADDEPLVGLRSLTDVSMARYSMATSVAPLRMHVQVMNDIQCCTYSI